MTSEQDRTDVPAAGADAAHDGTAPGWLPLIYRVPPEPTRLRSTVWRRIKSLDAIYPQNSVAALPVSTARRRRDSDTARADTVTISRTFFRALHCSFARFTVPEWSGVRAA